MSLEYLRQALAHAQKRHTVLTCVRNNNNNDNNNNIVLRPQECSLTAAE